MAFALIGPMAISTRQGESTSVTYQAVRTSRPYRKVTFSVVGLPAGITGTFNPAGGTPTVTTTLRLTASPSSPVGDFPVQVRARDAKSTKTIEVTLSNYLNRPVDPVPVTADVWVAKAADGGSESNDGRSQDTPKLLINSGFTVLNSLGGGKKMVIKQGTYTEDLNNNIPSGSSWSDGSLTKIHGYSGHTVIIKPATARNQLGHVLSLGSLSYIEFQDLEIDADYPNIAPTSGVGYSAFGIQSCDHIRLRRVVMHDCNSSFVLLGTSVQTFCEFVDCEIYNTGLDLAYGPGGNALYIEASNNLVDGGSYHHNGRGFGVRFGRSTAGFGLASNNVCRNARFYNNSEVAGNGGTITFWDEDNSVYNCLFYNNSGGMQVGRSADVRRAKLYNCTWFNDTVGGQNGIVEIGQSVNADDCEFKNLVFRSCQAPLLFLGTGTGNVFSKCQAEAAATNIDVVADCNFVSETSSSADFLKLSSTSGGRNTGTSTSPTVTTDIIGTTRPKGGTYDIGAYEYDE